jgi:hypothetical protein
MDTFCLHISIVHFDVYIFTKRCFSRAVVCYILTQGLQYSLSAFFGNVCGLETIVSLHSVQDRSMRFGDTQFSTCEGFAIRISCYSRMRTIAIKMHKSF